MSNTLKFGNGEWYGKEGTILAYNSENNNYKPLPFTFDRDSVATRVNKQGLIETVGSDQPRIDYLNDSNGALLLEPQSTNVLEKSEITSTWTYTEFGGGSSGTITTDKTDMFGGTNAIQIDFPSDAENVTLTFGQTTSSISSGSVSGSVYIKLVESGSKTLQLRCSSGLIRLINVDTTKFVRYKLSGTKNNNEAFSLKLRPSEGTSSGWFSIIVCQPQEEALPYATSYIPTQGSAVTRLQDVCSQTPPDGVIGQTEGTLFLDFEFDGNETVAYPPIINIDDGTSSKRFGILRNPNDTIHIYMVNISTQFAVNTTQISGRLKIALGYANNDIAVYVNGVSLYTTNSVSIPTTNKISLNRFGFNSTLNTKSNIYDVKLYNTRLSNSELAALTQV